MKFEHDYLNGQVKMLLAERNKRAMTGRRAISSSDDSWITPMTVRMARAFTCAQGNLDRAVSEHALSGRMNVDGFFQQVGKLKQPPSSPLKIQIEGVFFGAHLLYQGWWKRGADDVEGLISGEWVGGEEDVNEIRHWLNNGYEQWGPSWSFWNPKREGEEYLFGQIGSGDEANSIHVIVAPRKARKLIGDMDGRLAAAVSVHGTLYHDIHHQSNVHPNIQAALEKIRQSGGSLSGYYIVIQDEEDGGKISFDRISVMKNEDQPKVYSAYMWHCLGFMPDNSTMRVEEIPPQNTIHLWEHVNLMSRHSVDFHHEALQNKENSLQRKLSDKSLVVLQESYPVNDFLRHSRAKEPVFSRDSVSDTLAHTQEILNPEADKNTHSATIIPISSRKSPNEEPKQ